MTTFQVISPRGAQFYKYGPAQAFGPDKALPYGTRVTMLAREFGYSKVMLDDGQSGYLSTDEIKALPPEPKPSPTPPPAVAGRRSGRAKRSSQPPPQSVSGEPLFDLSDLPAPPLPEGGSSAPAPNPRFRY